MSGITSRGDKPDGIVQFEHCEFCWNWDVCYEAKTESKRVRDGKVAASIRLCGACICEDAELCDRIRRVK